MIASLFSVERAPDADQSWSLDLSIMIEAHSVILLLPQSPFAWLEPFSSLRTHDLLMIPCYTNNVYDIGAMALDFKSRIEWFSVPSPSLCFTPGRRW